jgi:hypothetical protein
MVDDDASDHIGPRENVLYLLAELERAFERGGVDSATQERLARLVVRVAETRGDTDESSSFTHPSSDGNQRGGLSSVTDGSSPKIDR